MCESKIGLTHFRFHFPSTTTTSRLLHLKLIQCVIQEQRNTFKKELLKKDLFSKKYAQKEKKSYGQQVVSLEFSFGKIFKTSNQPHFKFLVLIQNQHKHGVFGRSSLFVTLPPTAHCTFRGGTRKKCSPFFPF